LIAGLLKENFARFLLMVSIAKVGRYLFVYAGFAMF
jgi:membrane protein YqaA with SNARE-associated domain